MGPPPTHGQAKETQAQQTKMSLRVPETPSMLASGPHHTSTLMSHQSMSPKGQTHRPLKSWTQHGLWPASPPCQLAGCPAPSWVAELPEPDPTPPPDA